MWGRVHDFGRQIRRVKARIELAIKMTIMAHVRRSVVGFRDISIRRIARYRGKLRLKFKALLEFLVSHFCLFFEIEVFDLKIFVLILDRVAFFDKFTNSRESVLRLLGFILIIQSPSQILIKLLKIFLQFLYAAGSTFVAAALVSLVQVVFHVIIVGHIQFRTKYKFIKLVLETFNLVRDSLLHLPYSVILSHYLLLQNSDLVLLWHCMQLNKIVFQLAFIALLQKG